jgi:hypothetical protein
MVAVAVADKHLMAEMPQSFFLTLAVLVDQDNLSQDFLLIPQFIMELAVVLAEKQVVLADPVELADQVLR